jgi:hypothetical protein
MFLLKNPIKNPKWQSYKKPPCQYHKKESWVLELPKYIGFSMKLNKNWLICNLYGFGQNKILD